MNDLINEIAGSTNVTVTVWLQDATTGALKTGVTTTDLDYHYVRIETDNDVTISGAANITACASLTADHVDATMYEIGVGAYRLDIPDAMLTAGADYAAIYIWDAASGVILPVVQEIQLNLTTVVETGVATKLDTAIPGSPTADSINQRIAAVDDLMQASGDGDLAAVLVDTGTTIPALLGDIDSSVLQTTTIALLTSQTVFTLAAGSADDDAYNDCLIVVQDASTAVQKAVGLILDYVGSGKTITLSADPGIFTMANGDKVSIVAAPKNIADIKKLLRADKVIDTTVTPWTVEHKDEGTEDVLMTKDLKNTSGVDIINTNNTLGSLTQT